MRALDVRFLFLRMRALFERTDVGGFHVVIRMFLQPVLLGVFGVLISNVQNLIARHQTFDNQVHQAGLLLKFLHAHLCLVGAGLLPVVHVPWFVSENFRITVSSSICAEKPVIIFGLELLTIKTATDYYPLGILIKPCELQKRDFAPNAEDNGPITQNVEHSQKIG